MPRGREKNPCVTSWLVTASVTASPFFNVICLGSNSKRRAVTAIVRADSVDGAAVPREAAHAARVIATEMDERIDRILLKMTLLP
jgi:hypothetical protein